MVKSKFKVGDILRPKHNRHRSNDITIRNIKTLVVKRIYKRWNDDSYFTIDGKVLTGICTSYGNSHTVITVFDDAFELAKPKENYPIF